jgi:3,4-dihydroxy-2-butanone 4-phosphate synthase
LRGFGQSAILEEMSFATIPEALVDFRAGKMVVVVDDEDRENEGDLTMAAELVTPEAINFMATWGRGLICLALSAERCDALHLPLMSALNTSRFGTAFTESIDALEGVTTGISAADRSHSIRVAIDPKSTARDLAYFSAKGKRRRRLGSRRTDGSGGGSGSDVRVPARRSDLRNHERGRLHGEGSPSG